MGRKEDQYSDNEYRRHHPSNNNKQHKHNYNRNRAHRQQRQYDYSDDDDRYYDDREEDYVEHRKHYKRDRERHEERDDYHDSDRNFYGYGESSRRCKCDYDDYGNNSSRGSHSHKSSRRAVKRERPDSLPPANSHHYTPMPKTAISSTDDDGADRKLSSSTAVAASSNRSGSAATATKDTSGPTPRKSLLPTPQSLEEHIEKLLIGSRLERDVQKLSAVIGEILGMYKILGNPSEAIKSQFNRKIQLSDRRFAGYDTSFADNFEHVWSYALIEHCRTSSKTNKSFLMRFIDFSRVDGLVADAEERSSVAFRLLAAFSGLQLNDLIVEVADADELRDSALKAEGNNLRIIHLSGRYHIAICRQSLPVSGNSLVEAMTVYVILYFYFNLRFPDEWRDFLHILTVLMGLPLPPRKQLNDNIVDILNGAYEVIERKRRQLAVFKWTPNLLHNSAPAAPLVSQPSSSARSASGAAPSFSKSASTGGTGDGGAKKTSASSTTDHAILNKFHDFAASGVGVFTATAVDINASKPTHNGLTFSGILPTVNVIAATAPTGGSYSTVITTTASKLPSPSKSAAVKSTATVATCHSFDIENKVGNIDVPPSDGTAMAGFPTVNANDYVDRLAIKKIKRECYDEEEAFIID